jgi:hypothetical protein
MLCKAYHHCTVLRFAVVTLPRWFRQDSPALTVTTNNFTTQEKIMRTMRKFFVASILAFALSVSATAGDLHTGIQPEPTPTPAEVQGVISTPLNGEMHTGAPGDMHTTETSADVTLAGVVVDLVQGVLALL